MGDHSRVSVPLFLTMRYFTLLLRYWTLYYSATTSAHHTFPTGYFARLNNTNTLGNFAKTPQYQAVLGHYRAYTEHKERLRYP